MFFKLAFTQHVNFLIVILIRSFTYRQRDTCFNLLLSEVGWDSGSFLCSLPMLSVRNKYYIYNRNGFIIVMVNIKGYVYYFSAYQGVDESGAKSFTVLFPSGTPLPARRQHTLQAPGSISSVCLELYESEGKNSAKEEDKFAQVNT